MDPVRPRPATGHRQWRGQGLYGSTDPLPPDPPPDLTRIQLALTIVDGPSGLTVEFYRNSAYTCASSGSYSFVLLYRTATPAAEPRPLWVRLQGGGSGYFTGDDDFRPDEDAGPDIVYVPADLEFLTHEADWRQVLEFTIFPRLLDGNLTRFFDRGLMARIAGDAAGFRFLASSMCDNDVFSGVGAEDPNNPNNPDENGQPRRVDGLLALRAALDYARQRLATTHVFAHGTSAGAVGAMSLAISLGKEGRGLSGVIMDAGVLTGVYPQIIATGCNPNVPDQFPFFERLGTYTTGSSAFPHPALVESSHMPHAVIAAGGVPTPIFDLWNRGDPVYCGQTQLTVELDNGQAATGAAVDLLHKLLDEAIDTYNPGGASTWRRLCAGGATCSRHTVTVLNASTVGGDLDRGGEDWNQVVYDWVQERLADPPPGL